MGRPGAAPERLTLCLRGREWRGGRHGGVGEPAQEDGVQGESPARWPPGARPPLPSVPGGAWRGSARRASPAARGPRPEALCGAPASLRPRARDAAAGRGRGGGGQQRRGAEAPAPCRPAAVCGRSWERPARLGLNSPCERVLRSRPRGGARPPSPCRPGPAPRRCAFSSFPRLPQLRTRPRRSGAAGSMESLTSENVRGSLNTGPSTPPRVHSMTVSGT